ncbi:conserved exported hypothetical protein [Methylocella tundrae]|uniref:Flagellar basal body-associated protein FliL n=2 Tax=Methylocella tundrae TaxID=227605 RepID=A0A8B6M7L9_METTU|nr:conserved exported hypothetical protein [Methylocella tundrae]VTZ50062.1 conserved exported hypothetical protein [Methylocella tundrae]
MIRLVASCLWICVATLMSAYIGATWKAGAGQVKSAPRQFEHLEHKRTEAISVPMIADGDITGYVVAQFIYLIDPEALKQMSVPPDVFITDEAFRKLYVDKVDFNHLEKYDVAALTKDLVKRVNQRLGGDIIKDVLVEQFNYVPKQDISK